MTITGAMLGEILKLRRVTMPLTLVELSARSGVSPSYLGRIEGGKRFPSGRILRKLAQPLGFEETELLALAGYLSSPPPAEPGGGRLDPYVAKVLSAEPVKMQRAVLAILSALKSVAQHWEWPEFREYVHQKYPEVDEETITMIEGILAPKE